MKVSHIITVIHSLSLAAFVSAQISTTPGTSTTTITSPVTVLPSTSTSYLATTQSIQNVTTTTTNGSAVIVAVSPTFIIPRPSAAPEVAGEYKLRTRVKNGPPRFDGLYLGAWAIINNYYADAAFTKNKTEAAKFYLNGTAEQLDFGTKILWGMTSNFNTAASRWYSVQMHAPLTWNYGSFWFNNTGLQWTPNTSPPPHTGTLAALDAYFGGWMACDWYHGYPQLFYKVGSFNDTKIPCSCADVLLVPEYFK